jgi:long-subunit fatty acid transport protein
LRVHGHRLRVELGMGTALGVVLTSSLVSAAGFDTPILYTARHQAMGGAAIGYVDDPSAGFHNPAGLQGVEGLALLGDLSLVLGKVRSTPDDTAENQESNTVVAPFFLVGAGYRAHEWLSVGLAGFPVASGGAEYEYANSVGSGRTINSTEIVFFEITPFVSLNVPERLVPGKLAIGAGYRVSIVSFNREQGNVGDPQLLNLSLGGQDFKGFRIGAQYQPLEQLKLGVVFRNKVTVTSKADTVTVAARELTDAELPFTLPAKLGFGARGDLGDFGIATDLELAFQSQNGRAPLTGKLEGETLERQNVFDWEDGVTWRVGGEYRLLNGPHVPIRLGYIFDSAVTNRAYPSAFGTPPSVTHTLTAGAGYVAEHWQVNLAASRRFGSTRIEPGDLGEGCSFCSFAGDYSITMTGLYLDASVDLPL